MTRQMSTELIDELDAWAEDDLVPGDLVALIERASDSLEAIRKLTVKAMADDDLSQWGDHGAYYLAAEIGRILDA